MRGSFQANWEAWLSARPACVQALAREFPIWMVFNTPEGQMWVMGYTESDEVLLTPIDPREDYDGALAMHRQVHATCLRDAMEVQHVQPR